MGCGGCWPDLTEAERSTRPCTDECHKKGTCLECHAQELVREEIALTKKPWGVGVNDGGLGRPDYAVVVNDGKVPEDGIPKPAQIVVKVGANRTLAEHLVSLQSAYLLAEKHFEEG